MKKNFKSILVLCLAFGFNSCENDILDSNIGSSQEALMTKSVISYNDTIRKNKKFIYDGKVYNYIATIVNDSVININNQEVIGLFSEFKECSNLIKYIHDDGVVEFFKSRVDFENEIQNIINREKDIESLVQPLGADVPWGKHPLPDNSDNKIANIYLCDDDGYQDTYHQFDLRNGEKELKVPELKSYGLNDKVTSFAAYTIGGTTMFELFEDSDFKDDCIIFTVYSNNTMTKLEGDLVSKIPKPMEPQYGGLLLANLNEWCVLNQGSDTWNDRISSLRITRLN